MTTWRRTIAIMALLAVAACSGDDDNLAEQSAPATENDDADASDAAPDTAPTHDNADGGEIADGPTTSPAPPETGVPGLQSDDDFCAAWSRFGGSWQVLIQAAAIGDPSGVPRLEIAAAPTVADAYDELFRVWPAELEAERDTVADAYFGAFQRRSADAAAALDGAGATDADRQLLDTAWVAALAAYDPMNPLIELTLPAELEPLVAQAADTFASARVGVLEDPTLMITAATPLTDAFLATACPDQGWIVGQDV